MHELEHLDQVHEVFARIFLHELRQIEPESGEERRRGGSSSSSRSSR